jgi:hypothetical protein
LIKIFFNDFAVNISVSFFHQGLAPSKSPPVGETF